jgi:SAM-dependent methyltransferase
MSDQEPPIFRPPRDWEAVYAADPEGFRFGTEPSQIARTALNLFHLFGGDPTQSAALDLGSGEGRDTAFLAAVGFRVVARDVAPTGLVKTRTLLARQSIPRERVDLAVGDVRAFDYPSEAYDLALASNVYQFLEPDAVPGHIKRLRGTVKPGGLCAVGVFSPEMLAWGADIGGHFAATSQELAAYFPAADGWLLLNKTDYTTYVSDGVMASFAFVVARKVPTDL